MIRLEKISGSNFRDILELHVNDSQESFVAPNDISLAEAYIALANHGHAFPFGIYDDGTPVGFCMVGYGADDDWEDAPAVAAGNYNLWRFMIDRRYQGQGYGRQAFQMALDFVKTFPNGPAELCWLSYEPENEVAKKLYASFGFVEVPEHYKEGEEMPAILKL